jgi:hypothetical protein
VQLKKDSSDLQGSVLEQAERPQVASWDVSHFGRAVSIWMGVKVHDFFSTKMPRTHARDLQKDTETSRVAPTRRSRIEIISSWAEMLQQISSLRARQWQRRCTAPGSRSFSSNLTTAVCTLDRLVTAVSSQPKPTFEAKSPLVGAWKAPMLWDGFILLLCQRIFALPGPVVRVNCAV